MKEPRITSSDIAVWAFLDELRSDLRGVRDDNRALTISLRRSCEHFKVNDGCIAILAPDGSRADLLSVMPRGSSWDLKLLAAFLQEQRPRIPPSVIMAPVNRRHLAFGPLTSPKAIPHP